MEHDMATSRKLLCDRLENGYWQRWKEKNNFLEGETGIRLLGQPRFLSMKIMERCYGGRSRRRETEPDPQLTSVGIFRSAS